jgi:NarL family two-component system response regulator LiaR
VSYSVVLVDDHRIMRDGIKTILERTADFRIVGEAENGSDAVSLCKKLHPDLVLMDIGLPGMNGIEATPGFEGHDPVDVR